MGWKKEEKKSEEKKRKEKNKKRDGYIVRVVPCMFTGPQGRGADTRPGGGPPRPKAHHLLRWEKK